MSRLERRGATQGGGDGVKFLSCGSSGTHVSSTLSNSRIWISNFLFFFFHFDILINAHFIESDNSDDNGERGGG